MFWSSVISSGELLPAKLEMDPQYFVGLTSGMIIWCNTSTQDYIHSPRTKTLQLLNSWRTTLWKLSFICLSVQALQVYQNLQEYIQTIQVHPDCKDSWQYIWGNNAYTSSRFYNLAYKNVQPPTLFTWIWNSKCCNKLIVFSWLLLMEGNNYNRVLCDSVTAMLKRQLSIFLQLSLQSSMLATHWHALESCCEYLQNDSSRQATFLEFLLHGILHHWRLANLETKKQLYLWSWLPLFWFIETAFVRES